MSVRTVPADCADRINAPPAACTRSHAAPRGVGWPLATSTDSASPRYVRLCCTSSPSHCSTPSGAPAVLELVGPNGKTLQVVGDERQYEILPSRKVPVQRADANAAAPGDVVHRGRHTAGHERRMGDLQQPGAVAPGIGAQIAGSAIRWGRCQSGGSS